MIRKSFTIYNILAVSPRFVGDGYVKEPVGSLRDVALTSATDRNIRQAFRDAGYELPRKVDFKVEEVRKAVFAISNEDFFKIAKEVEK